MQSLKQALHNFGLKEKEIAVYLSILNLGKGTITDISKKSGLKRTSVYQYIEPLIKEGIICQTVVKKRIFYLPESPKKILKMLDAKKLQIEKSKNDIALILPKLENIFAKTQSRPNIVYYEGREGIKNAYEEMIVDNKKLYSFFSPKKVFEILSFDENEDLLMKVYTNGGMLYNLIEKSDEAEKRLKIKKYGKFIRNKILPENFVFDTDLVIGRNSIAMISFDNLLAVIIKDTAIAGLQKNIFEAIWKSIK
jgi:HTH-type transcriptional regulator, sugar sensing transcriptional regulator